MHDRHQPHAWAGTAMHRPDQIPHHHFVAHTKWTTGSSFDDNQSAKLSWPGFRNVFHPSLVSVSTDRPFIRSETSTTTASNQPLIQHTSRPFAERYGRCLDILHYGTNSTIRLHQTNLPGSSSKFRQLLAVKVYRYNILDSSNPQSRASHCASDLISNLHPQHPNILPIIDLLYNERSELCLVMPICAGGDLHELISHNGGPISTNEADCILAQILSALSFLHEHNTAHRDIRLETVLLTERGSVKLAGFGDGHIRRLWSECAVPAEETFRPRSQSHPASTTWSYPLHWLFSSSRGPSPRGSGDFIHNTASLPGMSLPYMPPERFHSRSYALEMDEDENNPCTSDIWAAAIIYVALITGRLLWRSARPKYEDPQYLDYVRCRCSEDGYPPIEALGKRRRNAIYAMLHPISRKRITASLLLRSEWITQVSICEAGRMGI